VTFTELAEHSARCLPTIRETKASIAQLSDRERTAFELTAAGYNGPEIGRSVPRSARRLRMLALR